MKKFIFKLEPVLQARKRSEDRMLRALADAQRSHASALSHKASLLEELEKTLLRREGLAAQPVSTVSFALENDYIAGIKQRVIQADQAILRASRSVEKAMRGYLSARRNTKAMETVKDKAVVEHKKSQNKLQEKAVDELNLMRFRLKQEEEA